MSKYRLTQRVYHTMQGRGYRLVCKKCNNPLLPAPLRPLDHKAAKIWDKSTEWDIESKPSKYRKWICEKCEYEIYEVPKKSKLVGNRWFYSCPKCNGIMYNVGRKLYHSDCYENLHIDVASILFIRMVEIITLRDLVRGILNGD